MALQRKEAFFVSRRKRTRGLPLGSVKDPPLGSKDYLEKKTIISNYIGIQSYLHNVVVVVVRLDRQTTNSIDNIASSSLVRSRAIAVAFP